MLCLGHHLSMNQWLYQPHDLISTLQIYSESHIPSSIISCCSFDMLFPDPPMSLLALNISHFVFPVRVVELESSITSTWYSIYAAKSEPIATTYIIVSVFMCTVQTSWVNLPPLLTATQYQQAWSRTFGTVLLAANNGHDESTSGSGLRAFMSTDFSQ